MKTKFIFFIIILAIVTEGITTFVLNRIQQNISTEPQITSNNILSECTTHAVGHVHYHAQLTITINGKNFPVPPNAGIDAGCMHPLHTHDASGTIHIDYYKPHSFTIGDFFTDWGMIFNRYQLGNLLMGQRYSMKMSVNKKENHEYEKYIIKDHDIIDIVVTTKK